jgi:hypothetical protein
MTTGGKLSMDVRRKRNNYEEPNDRAFHVDTLTASYEGSWPAASFSSRTDCWRFFRTAGQRCSKERTERVADLFGRLRVIVCKSPLLWSFNIKEFLTDMLEEQRRELEPTVRSTGIRGHVLSPSDAMNVFLETAMRGL